MILQNITVLKKFGQGGSFIEGFDSTHGVKNVFFDNLVIEGQRITNVLQAPIYPIAPDLYPTKPEWWTGDYQTPNAYRSEIVFGPAPNTPPPSATERHRAPGTCAFCVEVMTYCVLRGV